MHVMYECNSNTLGMDKTTEYSRVINNNQIAKHNQVDATNESTMNATQIILNSRELKWINEYKCAFETGNNKKTKLIKKITRNIFIYF